MARRTKEEALETRMQIIDAARRVFHAEGVNRSTLDKVAKAAGVTRGAVYWHFSSKQEILSLRIKLKWPGTTLAFLRCF